MFSCHEYLSVRLTFESPSAAPETTTHTTPHITYFIAESSQLTIVSTGSCKTRSNAKSPTHAHIDHGKSTLADRLLQSTHAVSDREAKEQLLDDMDLERERGITIKASAVTVKYDRADGESYMLNFIDTPGHVDFTYEVSRALKACEGALLVVDSTQGVEAQTVANAYLAINQDLELIPVVNKIDLPAAQPEEVAMEIEHVLGLPAEDCIYCSAKTGQGIDELLDAICERSPRPASPRPTRPAPSSSTPTTTTTAASSSTSVSSTGSSPSATRSA